MNNRRAGRDEYSWHEPAACWAVRYDLHRAGTCASLSAVNHEQTQRQPGQINWLKLLQSWALCALGVLIAANTSSGISYDTTGALITVVLLVSLFNIIIRPLLILFALPFVVLTLGLGLVVINALILLLVEAIVPGFHLASFWSALWAAVVISIVSMIANLLLGRGRVKISVQRHGPGGTASRGSPRRKLPKDDDVIDI